MNNLQKSKNILFITKSDPGRGSSRYRAFQVMRRLKQRGWNAKLGYICRTKIKPDKWLFYANFLKTILEIIFKQVDLVYFQRADRRWKKTRIIANLCRRFNIKTIFDIDDEINWEKSNRTIELINKSSAVIVASHVLYDEVKTRHQQVFLLPTPFDERIYNVFGDKNFDQKIICGFVGDGRTYFDGLKELFNSINQLDKHIKECLNFQYLGDNIAAIRQLIDTHCHDININIIEAINWSDEISLINIISRWHIGFTPRRIDPKGGAFKTIQYLALNIIPIVWSAGENLYFIQHGKNGFIVNNPSEWREILMTLLENRKLMQKIALKNHSSVERFSLKNYTDSLERIFENLLNNSDSFTRN